MEQLHTLASSAIIRSLSVTWNKDVKAHLRIRTGGEIINASKHAVRRHTHFLHLRFDFNCQPCCFILWKRLGIHCTFQVDTLRTFTLQNVGTPISGWVPAPQGSILNRAAQDNPQTLAACLHIARLEQGISRCFCVHIGYDPQTLSVIPDAVQTASVWWPT